PATINTRLSGLDSGIAEVADALDALVVEGGTSDAETIAARTFVKYLRGSPPASIGLALSYASGGGYNVLAYGAAGNGSDDDTLAVQEALDAANSAGGGVVFLPPGTYKITTLEAFANITLRGAGQKSIISWAGTLNQIAIEVTGSNVVIENLLIQNL